MVLQDYGLLLPVALSALFCNLAMVLQDYKGGRLLPPGAQGEANISENQGGFYRGFRVRR